MTKKDYLNQYKTLNDCIKRKLEELEHWKCLSTKITPCYSDMPKGGECSDKIQTSVEKIVLLEKELDRDIDRLVDLKREIESKINAVDDNTLRLLLQYRYIDGFTFEKIACKMFYSFKWIHKLHSDALNKIST